MESGNEYKLEFTILKLLLFEVDYYADKIHQLQQRDMDVQGAVFKF